MVDIRSLGRRRKSRSDLAASQRRKRRSHASDEKSDVAGNPRGPAGHSFPAGLRVAEIAEKAIESRQKTCYFCNLWKHGHELKMQDSPQFSTSGSNRLPCMGFRRSEIRILSPRHDKARRDIRLRRASSCCTGRPTGILDQVWRPQAAWPTKAGTASRAQAALRRALSLGCSPLSRRRDSG